MMREQAAAPNVGKGLREMLASLEEIAGEILGGDDWGGSRDAIGASGGCKG